MNEQREQADQDQDAASNAVSKASATVEQLFPEWLAGKSADEEVMPGITVRELMWLLTPPPAPPGTRWCPDVVYGRADKVDRDLVMDLYAANVGQLRPGIVFIHGGGWSGGHRYLLVRQAGEMAAKGYVTATISYRLSVEAKWPAALEDAKCAVRWMRAHAAEIGLDSRQIAVAGGSAGGHLAAMVALTPGRFEGTGGWHAVSSHVQAAVLYNPVLDLRNASLNDGIRTYVEAFLGSGAALQSEASPLTYLTAECPPILTRVGDQDRTTPAAICQTFHDLLDVAGVSNRLEILAGKAHGIPVYDHAGCVRSVATFLAEHFVMARAEAP